MNSISAVKPTEIRDKTNGNGHVREMKSKSVISGKGVEKNSDVFQFGPKKVVSIRLSPGEPKP